MIGLITCMAFTPAVKQSTLSVEHSSSFQDPSSVHSFVQQSFPVSQPSLVQPLSVVSDCNQAAANWVEAPMTEANLQQQYYWFFYPGDYYWDHKTLADEINEMWMLYGAPVDTHPSPNLIDRAYNNEGYPHSNYPLVYLYVHY